MADRADDGDGDIFVYRGGRAPHHVTHVLIDRSLVEIEDNAFENCRRLLQVDTHDGLRKIGRRAFIYCESLKRINLKSVVEIDVQAFWRCENLESVEFGNRLETIGRNVFSYCTSLKLKHLNLPSIVAVGICAFLDCKRLTDIELSEGLETIGLAAFCGCSRLQRIAVPLKRDLFEFRYANQKYNQFEECEQLSTVDLVGGIHKTAASLHLENWRAEMIAEINRINQVLPTTPAFRKSDEIQQWMEAVIDRMDHYKAEHHRYVKEGIILLELALWKAKLLGVKEDHSEEETPRRTEIDIKAARRDKRITCGADMVIKNVLPFLKLE